MGAIFLPRAEWRWSSTSSKATRTARLSRAASTTQQQAAIRSAKKQNHFRWKSDSSKHNGGYNEFVFDDHKDLEKIRMHAERDHEVTVKHAEPGRSARLLNLAGQSVPAARPSSMATTN